MSFGDIILDGKFEGEAENKVEDKKRPVNHVFFVMDHSGSMSSMKKQAIDGFNEHVQVLKAAKDQTNLVTLIDFNQWVKVRFKNMPVQKVEEITDYHTEGLTALLDAIGRATEIITQETKVLDMDLNEEALLIIISDGYENTSKKYDYEKIKSIKGELEDTKKKVMFSFIGCDEKFLTERILKDMGFSAGNTMSFTAGANGYRLSSQHVNSSLYKYTASRSVGINTEEMLTKGGFFDNQTESKTNEENTEQD